MQKKEETSSHSAHNTTAESGVKRVSTAIASLHRPQCSLLSQASAWHTHSCAARDNRKGSILGDAAIAAARGPAMWTDTNSSSARTKPRLHRSEVNASAAVSVHRGTLLYSILSEHGVRVAHSQQSQWRACHPNKRNKTGQTSRCNSGTHSAEQKEYSSTSQAFSHSIGTSARDKWVEACLWLVATETRPLTWRQRGSEAALPRTLFERTVTLLRGFERQARQPPPLPPLLHTHHRGQE